MELIEKLNEIKNFGGKRLTSGLSAEAIGEFLETDEKLREAIEVAYSRFRKLVDGDHADLLKKDEAEQIEDLQEGVLNFYAPDATNPYVPLAASGPWIVSTGGAVIHDNGGYGMLGLGHNPKPVIKAMASDQVMANVMTASCSLRRFIDTLRKNIGMDRDRCPYDRFLCLNSGSESVTVAARLSDANALIQTSKGGKHEGKKIKFLSFHGSFHGRTERPAQVSYSSIGKYKSLLASFRDRDNLVTITPNHIEELEQVYKDAEKDGVFYEALFIEPVMGEGNPGQGVTPEFFKRARELTRANQSMFFVDSIQAGLRAHGCLSICDYPGFEKLDPPDMETFSKALNAGQYPLSVLAMTSEAADLYKIGLYGNTMTGNPRALDVACVVLSMVDDKIRQNIRDKGVEFVEKFKGLQQEFPDIITHVQGTGLLFSVAISEKKYKVVGFDGLELALRKMGLGVIHGGVNSLRFTPHFAINSQEIDLIIDLVRQAFHNVAPIS